MKILIRSFLFGGMLLIGLTAVAKEPLRPPVYAIAHVRLCKSDPVRSVAFYQTTLGFLPVSQRAVNEKKRNAFWVNDVAQIDLECEQPQGAPLEIGFLTTDVAKMRKFLQSRGFHPSQIRTHWSSHAEFSMQDPEGHPIAFVQRPKVYFMDLNHDHRVSRSLIHAGFVVRNRAAEDHFYKDTLGFRLYWHGGMKDDEDRWVAMQVPDGTDWIEYMLNVPSDASHHTLGVMNHISLGVEDIHAAENKLVANGWKPGEAPKIGRDGKWQLNLYDPDETRVEFMEFTPKERPCCSEFTGPHPGPQASSSPEPRPKR
jgi:catechol 2,3-dioxygenase-like lactoylglutathione lyase family enzyme